MLVYNFFNGVDHAAPGTSAYIFKMVELATFVIPLAICWESPQSVLLSIVFTCSSHAECICCGSFVCVFDIFLYDYVKKGVCFMQTPIYYCLGSMGLFSFFPKLAQFHYIW